MNDDENEVTSKITEINFGYHHVNESGLVVYPGRCQLNVDNGIVFFLNPICWNCSCQFVLKEGGEESVGGESCEENYRKETKLRVIRRF